MYDRCMYVCNVVVPTFFPYLLTYFPIDPNRLA